MLLCENKKKKKKKNSCAVCRMSGSALIGEYNYLTIDLAKKIIKMFLKDFHFPSFEPPSGM